MRLVRCLAALGSCLILLLAVQAGVAAQWGSAATDVQRPQDETPQFTRFLTVTLEAGSPVSTALYSRWSNVYLGFPVGPLGISWSVDLPADSTEITASVQHGSFNIVDTTIYFTLTQTSDFSWSYRTAEKVRRAGNQYQIDQRASSNTYFRYISTILFPGPYQYVGTITFAPQLVTSDTVYWDVVVPPVAPNVHIFNASSWLADPRLGQPDLSFTDAALTIAAPLNPPIAYLTATIRNNNDVDVTSTVAFLEFYDRASPSAPPSGPLDHAGGWCGTGTVPVCPNFETFGNPVQPLGPGETTTVFMTYPLTHPGLRDFYFQIDTFGGPNGLNLEFNEDNNVYTLTQGVAVDYLAGVVISGPLTGTAQTPLPFTAQVTPSLETSRPLTYTWSPVPLSGQGTANATYSWGVGAPQTIAVTVRNASQTTVTGTHTISIEVPLTAVSISGPITVSRDIAHAYQVSAQPVTATLPISTLWSPEPDQGQTTFVATYALAELGEHLLSAYVSNPLGPGITATHTVVAVPPLTSVNIDGPTAPRLFAALTFTATTQPIDPAPPLNYLWSPAPASGQGKARVTYQWTTPGTYTITVTVSNDSGPIVGSRAITIESVRVYLPLLRKS